jgi:hypothetical protein
MNYHIKIGERSLCQCGSILRLVGGIKNLSALMRRGLMPTCGHGLLQEAQNVANVLRHHGNDARVVEGECDQRDPL